MDHAPEAFSGCPGKSRGSSASPQKRRDTERIARRGPSTRVECVRAAHKEHLWNCRGRDSCRFRKADDSGVGVAPLRNELNQIPQLCFVFESYESSKSFETLNSEVGREIRSGFRVAFQQELIETIRSFRPGPALSGIRVEDSPESYGPSGESICPSATLTWHKSFTVVRIF